MALQRFVRVGGGEALDVCGGVGVVGEVGGEIGLELCVVCDVGGAEEGEERAFVFLVADDDGDSGVVSVLGVLFDGFGEGERENDCLISDRSFFPFPLRR